MNGLTRISAWLGGLRGWRALLLAFAAGAVSATAFAPLDVFPALLLGLAVLVLLLDGGIAEDARAVRRAAGLGWAFAFGQFLIGLHWIGYAFLVDPTNHLWQMPFAVVSLPGPRGGDARSGALVVGLARASSTGRAAAGRRATMESRAAVSAVSEGARCSVLF